jgi:hypothetical protein
MKAPEPQILEASPRPTHRRSRRQNTDSAGLRAHYRLRQARSHLLDGLPEDVVVVRAIAAA